MIILDGWGVSSRRAGNAIAQARTPFYDEICTKYPQSVLAAAGASVGLASNASGNAEVGHLNIGAGRVVKTDVARIEDAIKSEQFFENAALKSAISKAAESGKPVHLIGLLSDGEIHSAPESLYALLRMAKRERVKEVFVHGILDGRDVPPRTADIYVEALEIKMADIGIGKIATLCGRFFAMDNSENWERTARAFTMLVHAEGERSLDAVMAIRGSFLRGISDEFIAPIVLESKPDVPVATIKEGDTVIFFNHRADTMRQLARSVAVPEPGASAIKPHVEAVCLTEYDRSFSLPVAFPPESEKNTLAQLFTQHGIANYRITEGDRFAHLTQFFNGGADFTSQYERAVQVPTSNVATREAEPEMQSFKITDKLLRSIETDPEGIFIVNLPAADLVAETGNFDKTVESIQFMDTCLGGIVERIRMENGVAIITSSHGNCEEMVMENTGEPNRVPTSNSVPFHLITERADRIRLREQGSLQDIAPTILGIVGIEKPPEMTGSDLRIF